MRHASAGRRSRGRGNGGRRGGPNKAQVFDSNGPDVRIRGTAHQIFEKYMALAKDASSVGDTILAESYLQHAEHYQRIINSFVQEAQGSSQSHSHGRDAAEKKERQEADGNASEVVSDKTSDKTSDKASEKTSEKAKESSKEKTLEDA